MVVDASVALAWCIESESTDYSVALLDRLRDDVGLVPTIWPIEVANALLIAERRGRLSTAQIERALHLLRLPIEVVDRPLADPFEVILPLARQKGLSTYDAAYAHLAARERCSLATLDRRMGVTAERLGVPLTKADPDGT